jgi:hypothetical protein
MFCGKLGHHILGSLLPFASSFQLLLNHLQGFIQSTLQIQSLLLCFGRRTCPMNVAATTDALASAKYQKQHLEYHVLQQSSRKSRTHQVTCGSLQLLDLL